MNSHQVTKSECEQLFFNHPLLIGNTETRYYALGQTDDERQLFVVCTIRDNLIRVISARDMSKKEREVYLK